MDIKGYIVTVICVCVASSVVSLLSPEGESGIGRQVRVAAGLVTALAVIAPIVGIVRGLGEIDISGLASDAEEREEEYQSIFEDRLSAFEEESICDGIKDILKKNFSIDPAECAVTVTLEEASGEKRIKRVFITLYGSAIWIDSGAVEDYLRELLSCEIVIAVG